MTAPARDGDSASFWDGLRGRRILLQRCAACGRTRFPPMPGCPYCGGADHEEIEVDGVGRLYSWVRVHRALTPATDGDLPYNVGVVELEAGPRVLARFDGQTVIGALAIPTFADHGDWTELRYRVGP